MECKSRKGIEDSNLHCLADFKTLAESCDYVTADDCLRILQCSTMCYVWNRARNGLSSLTDEIWSCLQKYIEYMDISISQNLRQETYSQETWVSYTSTKPHKANNIYILSTIHLPIQPLRTLPADLKEVYLTCHFRIHIYIGLKSQQNGTSYPLHQSWRQAHQSTDQHNGIYPSPHL